MINQNVEKNVERVGAVTKIKEAEPHVMVNRSGLIVFLAVFLLGCDSNRIYDEYKSVADQWQKDDMVEFEVTPPDTLNAYHLFVNLRNNNDYAFNNIYLIVEMNHPNGKVVRDTLEYRMADADGQFLGSGFSDIKENKLWYRKGQRFTENGTYMIRIGHVMREIGEVEGVDVLNGILDVGIRIEEPNL